MNYKLFRPIHIASFGVIAMVLLWQLSACNSNKKTSGGTEYKFIQGKELDSMYGPNHMILMKHLVLGPDGDTLQNGFASDSMEEIPYPVAANSDIKEVLQKMSPESTVEIYIPTDSLKLRMPGNPKIEALSSGKRVTFLIKVFKVLDFAEYDTYRNTKMLTRIMAENKFIDNYAANHGGGWLLDSSRMIKFRISSGKVADQAQSIEYSNSYSDLLQNAPIHKGKSISFDCEVSTLDGVPIVNSVMEGRKYKAIYDEQFFDIPVLNTLPFYVPSNMKAEFLVTSGDGFGAAGRVGIPSYAPLRVLIFNVEIIK
jgi:hypothetical protein